jgi:hypothetical protein
VRGEFQPGAVAPGEDASGEVPDARPSARRQQRLQVPAGKVRGSRRETAQGGEQRAGRERGQGALEHPGREPEDPADCAGLLQQPCGPRLERLVVEPQRLGEPIQVCDDPGVVVARDQREQFAADPVAQIARRTVAAVCAPGQTARLQPGLDLGAPREEQGVHEQPGVARGRDPAETGGTRASDDAHQQCLGLVVRGVRERDAPAPPPRQTQQEGQALLPGEFLDRGPPSLRRGERPPETQVKAQPEVARRALSRRGVAIRGAPAQAVVEVGDLDLDAEPPACTEQQMEEAGRVRPAGKGRDHAGAGRKQRVPRGVGEERRQQRGA